MPSASVIAASLPDTTIKPRIKSHTGTSLCALRNIREPSTFHAFSDTVSFCSGCNLPSSNALNAK